MTNVRDASATNAFSCTRLSGQGMQMIMASPGIRDTIRSLDRTFVFNLLIDSFALTLANALILMIQFELVTQGFLLMLLGLTLWVFEFSFFHGESLFGAAFALFMLGSLDATEAVYP
jgi:hypothetical protein